MCRVYILYQRLLVIFHDEKSNLSWLLNSIQETTIKSVSGLLILTLMRRYGILI